MNNYYEEGSLFGGIDDEVLSKSRTTVIPAIRKNIPVAGVHLNPNLQISPTLAQNLLNSIEEGAYFTSGANQVMLFGRNCIGLDGGHSSGLSPFLDNLVQELSVICRPHLPYRVFSLLFPDPKEMPCARQVILNRYNPGQGITPHVDLLQRYGDGIIGLSLGSGCVMEFGKVNDDENAEAPRVGVWLEENSIIVLEGEAR
jgi:hypothetical protein